MLKASLAAVRVSASTSRKRRISFRLGAALFLIQGWTCNYSWAQQARRIYSLTQSCRQSGESSPEISHLLTVIAQRPSAEAYRSLGEAYGDRNELNCAILAFESSLRLDQKSWDTRYALALALIQAGDANRAASELRLIIGHQPDSLLAHNALGLALESLGSFDAAAGEFKTALNLDPKFALGYYNLAHVLTAEKRYAAAVFYLQKAVSLQPDEPAYRLALAAAYGQDQKFDQAIDLLRNLISSHPDLPEAYFNLATAYTQQKRYREAVENYKQALRLNRQNDVVCMRRLPGIHIESVESELTGETLLRCGSVASF